MTKEINQLPINEIPIAVFINSNKADVTLLDFAKKIIAKTHKIFIRGSSNHIMDIIKNPNAYYELESSRNQIMPLDFSHPNLFKLTEILNPKDGGHFINMLNSLLRSHKNKIGNCGEMTVVGLHFITIDGSEILHTATLVKLTHGDHAFIKLESKDNKVIFIDPWYKTYEHHGAIFDIPSSNIYLLNLSKMLSTSQLMNLIGPIYPDRHIIGIALLALGIYDEHPQRPLIIIGIISIISSFLILLTMLARITFRPAIIERVQLKNSNEQSTLSFELFKTICDHNLERININPVLFSNDASNLKSNIQDLSIVKKEARLPNNNTSLGLFAS